MKPAIKKPLKPKLGELLVEYGIITSNMLKNALKRQSQAGGQIGSTLIEMEYITTDVLLEFLSKQLGVPSVNLFKLNISPETLKLLPLDKIKELKVLPLEFDNKFTLAMVDPTDYIAIRDIEFILGKSVDPVVIASSQMEAAIKSLDARGSVGIRGAEIEKSLERMPEDVAGDMKMLLKQLVESNASDLQLTAGVPPSFKMGSELRRLSMSPLTPEQMNTYAKALLSVDQQKSFDIASELDFAFTDRELGRFRVNLYKQRNSVSITIRLIPDHIPGLKELGLPDELEPFALKTQGLILITGPAGHGKSTTLAALVDIINTKRKCNIITLEDPIEYLHKHKNCNVNQREILTDTSSFQDGLKHIFRQDPDVIVIGEMRDPESFRIALQAAETGHLVLSTLHSRNATSTIERVIDIFPPHQQTQIRNQLAESLLLVLSQRLVIKKDGSGLVLAFEKLINTLKIKNFIRDGKTHHIRSQMQIAGEEYSSIDVGLARLCMEGVITAEEGARHSDDPAFYQNLIKGGRTGRVQ
jgi:twitching motility protein PilT